MEYNIVTVWHIEAPLETVYELISQSLNWPQWWCNVKSVEEIAPGDTKGVGNIRRYTWQGVLPYRLIFDICVTHIEPQVVIEGIASGDLEGYGRWSFSSNDAVTIVRYEWQVRTTSFWMNLLELFAYPLIKWNHNLVMRQGGKALAHKLNSRLIQVVHYSR